ncbi:fatty-acyl-CoA synthase [Antricoccus suffuscus]|uniref:Fatty-acyl-CoA synthase n=1 Tax=Antricoccus suffuscus TaxID=1629062 RepID=A0A2T0ZYR4_9ACTN|nr:long-chain fatty acid--CoA ligase [Antricoccus suffuscus]PRZ41473.1 fatty-acyl-CoA synthase [Antricoccus suffuscus]
MQGTMQQSQLTLVDIFERAERMFPDHAIITGGPNPHRYTYGDWAKRTRQLGTVLDNLGLSADARVGSFCWNHYRHLELYFAAPCSGRVLHTLNIRLFPEQLVYVVNHAEDEAIFVDRSLLPLFLPILDQLTTVKHVVVIDDGSGPEVPNDPRFSDYETLLDGAAPAQFHIDDENQASSMCYTSGTTGNPKGVLYSHRSTWLHSMAVTSTTTIGLDNNDRVLVIVPMFHANAWGTPYAAPMCGAELIFPGSDMSPANLAGLIQDEKATFAMGVPTIWQGIAPIIDDYDFSSLRRITAGGSATPESVIKFFEDKLGIEMICGWGMTETSPVASISNVDHRDQGKSPDEKVKIHAKAGTIVAGVQARIVEPDTTTALPWDDEANGELQVRGPWIAADYYKPDAGVELTTEDGWMKTGDIAAISQYGVLRLIDRTKDLVKSGGEWISSVDVENIIMGHPDVAEAAIVAIPHPKWTERPLACVVLKPGVEQSDAKKAEILEFLAPQIAKWWMPDALEFIDEVPKTSVGKFSKKDLRSKFDSYELPEVAR